MWNLILWPGSDILYSLEMIWKWKAIHCCNNCCISNADQFPTGHTEQMASWQHLIDSIQPADDILMTDGNVRGLTDFTSWLLSSFFFNCAKSLYQKGHFNLMLYFWWLLCPCPLCLWAEHWKGLNLISMQIAILHFKRISASFFVFPSFKIPIHYLFIFLFLPTKVKFCFSDWLTSHTKITPKLLVGILWHLARVN